MSPSHPSKILIVLAISCLVWIGAISFAAVYFLGASVSIGWVIGCILLVAMAGWITMMLREIRNAVEVPNSPSNQDETSNPAEKSPLGRALTGITNTRQTAPARARKSLPRKLRSGGAEIPSLIGH